MSRKPGDCYYTPDQLARAIVARSKRVVPTNPDALIIEPSCGEGAFLRAVVEASPSRIIANDVADISASTRSLAHNHEICFTKGDWLVYDGPKADLIVANFPYSHAEAHTRKALATLKDGGALVSLTRQSFLASGDRVIEGWNKRIKKPLWVEHPPAFIDFLAPRPSFTGNGTDGAEYCVITWIKDDLQKQVPPRVDWLIWRHEPARRRRRKAEAAE